MTHVVGFPPVSRSNGTALVLGTLPGQDSIDAGEYYAHQRNVFWKIMGELFGASLERAYVERLKAMKSNGVALWDVLASARRAGSLDSAIDKSTVEVNDFSQFYAEHRRIRLTCFNGRGAEDFYKRRVLPGLEGWSREISLRLLPSTSPMNTTKTFKEKLAEWSIIKSHSSRI